MDDKARGGTGSAWFGAEHVLISQLRAQTDQGTAEFTQWPFSCTAVLTSRRLEGTEKFI